MRQLITKKWPIEEDFYWLRAWTFIKIKCMKKIQKAGIKTILVCAFSFGLKMHIENVHEGKNKHQCYFWESQGKKHWNSEKIPTQCGAGQPAAYEVYTVCIHKRRAYSFFLASPYCVLQSLSWKLSCINLNNKPRWRCD